jgi:hypothetical protein
MKSRKNLTLAEAQAFAEQMHGVDWNNSEQRRAIAETIVFDVKSIVNFDNILAQMGVEEVRFLPGQTVQFTTKKGLKAFVHEPGSYAPRSVLTQRVVNLTPELVSVNGEMEIGQLQAGRYGTVQDVKDMAVEQLTGKKYSILWNILTNSKAATDPGYYSIAAAVAGTVKKNTLDSGFDYVADVPGSEVVAIVGRRTALSWIADFDSYGSNGPSEKLRETLDTKAYPDTYRGVPVVYLPNYVDGWGITGITASDIMILGRNTIKLGYSRELNFMESTDSNTLNWNLHMFEEYGACLFMAERNARIVLT